MKRVDVKDNTHIDSTELHSNKDPKFKVGDHVRISKYKNIFAKGCTPNWSEEIFVIKNDSSFNSWIDKKDLIRQACIYRIKMSQYFPKPYEPFGGDINVRADLSNYATKTDIKNISHVDTSSFALKSNLANLKTEVDKLDIDKLVPIPADLSKLSDIVKRLLSKKLCMINQLIK